MATNNKPAAELRIGAVKATVWENEVRGWECAPKTGQISSKIENRPIGAFQVHELLELDRRTIAD